MIDALPQWRITHGRLGEVEIQCRSCDRGMTGDRAIADALLRMAMHCTCEKPAQMHHAVASSGAVRLIRWLTEGTPEAVRLESWKRQQELNAQHAERQRDAAACDYMKRKENERFEEWLYCRYNAGEPLSANHEVMAKRVYDRCGQWGYFPPR